MRDTTRAGGLRKVGNNLHHGEYTRDGPGELEEFTGVRLGNPNPNTGLPSQMSDGWIEYVALELIKKETTSEIGQKILDLIEEEASIIKKYVSAIDRTRGEVNFLKLGNY